MFKTYYQLSAEPFRLSPDSRFCFPHPSYRKALIYMRHAIQRGEGFVMITGRPGTGKTTVIQHLLRMLKPGEIVVAKLVTTQLAADDLLRLVAYSFNLNPEGANKAKLLIQVEHFLRQQHRQTRRALLIVDEAQDMTVEALEELRLLTNIQSGVQQLLQIFLVGQEKLQNLVTAPSLEQLQQRMIAATHLEALDEDQTKNYIEYRLLRVNWSGDPLFSNEAFALIHRYSRGIPRQINQICNRLLLHGSIEKKHRLGLADVHTVAGELHDELLLSMGLAEFTETSASRGELPPETYDEQPRRRQRAALEPELTPGAGNRTAQWEEGAHRNVTLPQEPSAKAHEAPSDEATTERQYDKPGKKIHLGPAEQQTAVASAPGDRIDVQRPTPSVAARMPEHNKTESPEERKSNPVAIIVIPGIVLLAGVLVGLLYATKPDLIRAASHSVTSWIDSSMQRIHRLANLQPPKAKVVVSSQDTSKGTVQRSPLAAVDAPVTREVVSAMQEDSPGDRNASRRTVQRNPLAAVDAPVTREVVSVMPEDSPAEPPVSAMAGQIEKRNQEQPQAMLPALAAELTRNALHFEQVGDDTLKVLLGSDGLFDLNSAQIKDSAVPALNVLAAVLREQDHATLRIVGHTDSSGTAEYNQYLSELRARAVADRLIALGIPATDIQSEGRGDIDTRHENLSAGQRSLKRRVEIYIILPSCGPCTEERSQGRIHRID